jgi:hypothetical protein
MRALSTITAFLLIISTSASALDAQPYQDAETQTRLAFQNFSRAGWYTVYSDNLGMGVTYVPTENGAVLVVPVTSGFYIASNLYRRIVNPVLERLYRTEEVPTVLSAGYEYRASTNYLIRATPFVTVRGSGVTPALSLSVSSIF